MKFSDLDFVLYVPFVKNHLYDFNFNFWRIKRHSILYCEKNWTINLVRLLASQCLYLQCMMEFEGKNTHKTDQNQSTIFDFIVENKMELFSLVCRVRNKYCKENHPFKL